MFLSRFAIIIRATFKKEGDDDDDKDGVRSRVFHKLP